MSLGKKGGRSICHVPGVEIEGKGDEEWKYMSLETEMIPKKNASFPEDIPSRDNLMNSG